MRVAGILLGSIPIIIQLYVQKYRQEDFSKTLTELENEYDVPTPKTYDFIIVGGGTAGCVLAGRLSEKFNVLLLEAGGNPPPQAAVQYFTRSVYLDPTINYLFKPIAAANGSTNGNEISIVNAGKMMGGSGSENCMNHNRGSPHDFDHWGTLLNDSSWNYNNVLQHFIRSENYIGERYGAKDEDQYYGKVGPISVQVSKIPLLEPWFQAGKELGYEINDPNGFQTESFAPMVLAMDKNGRRSSSYTGYIKPFENVRQNLTVIRYANVSEILLDKNNQAFGVAYSRHDIFPQIAHASKEVIISTGTFSSPMLLMKSGIGPVEILEAAEIPVKVPLEAVGKNLATHASVTLQSFSVNDTSIFTGILESDVFVKKFHEEDGDLTGEPNGAQLFKVSTKSEEKDWPDLYIKIGPPLLFNGQDGTFEFSVVLGRPKSRGLISLHTENYKNGIRDDVQLAMMDYKFYAHPDDIEAMLEGVKLVFDIVEKTKSFQSVNMTYGAAPTYGCQGHVFRSDDYWRCHIRQKTVPWHMVGTCSMGPETGNSNDSVVDNKFRVRGVQGLRIVDASVMPSVTNANINAPTLMLAEKAADEIQKYWNMQKDCSKPHPDMRNIETSCLAQPFLNRGLNF